MRVCVIIELRMIEFNAWLSWIQSLNFLFQFNPFVAMNIMYTSTSYLLDSSNVSNLTHLITFLMFINEQLIMIKNKIILN